MTNDNPTKSDGPPPQPEAQPLGMTSVGKWISRNTRHLAFFVHPYFLLGGLFVLGVSLIFVNGVFGFKAADTPDAWSSDWLLAQGEKIGYIFAVSGVIGVVSRMLWLTGVLAKALSDVMLGDAVLDIRNDLPQLWRRLTQRIYLRGFEARTPQDEAFLENVHRAMGRSIAQRHDFYARNMDAHYVIKAVEGEPSKLKVTKTISYDLHPFHPDRSIVHVTSVKAATGVDVDDYDLEEDAYTVDGVSVLDKRKTEREGDKIIRWIELSGKKRYSIERVVTSFILLDKDPILLFASPYVIEDLTFRATCYAPSLVTFFQEVGVEDAFDDKLLSDSKARSRGDQHRRNTGILLPEQGFVFVVKRRGRATVANPG